MGRSFGWYRINRGPLSHQVWLKKAPSLFQGQWRRHYLKSSAGGEIFSSGTYNNIQTNKQQLKVNDKASFLFKGGWFRPVTKSSEGVMSLFAWSILDIHSLFFDWSDLGFPYVVNRRISMTMIRPSLDVVYRICRGLPNVIWPRPSTRYSYPGGTWNLQFW